MTTREEKKKIFETLKGSETHWFITPQSITDSTFEPPQKRLNSIDTNMLEESSSPGFEDSSLSLEYRIKTKKETITELNKKIRIAEELGNRQDLFVLKAKKQRIDSELKSLSKEYFSADNSKYYSNKNSAATLHKKTFINTINRFIRRYVLAKISKRFSLLVSLGDSLETLNAINRNVDELMKTKTPYGETKQNYEKLTEYLNTANKIRSQINRSMKK